MATSSRRTGFPWGRGCCWVDGEASRFLPSPLFLGGDNSTRCQGPRVPARPPQSRSLPGVPAVSPHLTAGDRRPHERAHPGHRSFPSPRPQPPAAGWGEEPRAAAQTMCSGGTLWGGGAWGPCGGFGPVVQPLETRPSPSLRWSRGGAVCVQSTRRLPGVGAQGV